MTLFAVAEAIAQAVVLESDLKRFEADAAIAGMNLPREHDPEEPPLIGWTGRMTCSNTTLANVLIE